MIRRSVIHGEASGVGPKYCSWEWQTTDYSTKAAFDWTRPGWCGGEEEVVEQMKTTASCPPRPGRWKTDETLLPGNHCLHPSTHFIAISRRRHVSVITITCRDFFYTTNKAEQIKVSQVCSPPANMSSICGKAAWINWFMHFKSRCVTLCCKTQIRFDFSGTLVSSF